MTTATGPRDSLRLPPSRHPVPTRNAVRTRRVPLVAYIVVLLGLPIAVLVGARATGWWVTAGRTVPTTAVGADALGTGAQNGAGNGEGGGADASVSSPHDVKGSMTVQQVVDAFPQVTAAEVFQQFGVPENTPTSTQLKTLVKDGNGFEVSALREWLESRIEQ